MSTIASTKTKITKSARSVKGGERYVEAVGRRKTAVARVRLTPASKQSVSINNRSIEVYFGREPLRTLALAPLACEGISGKYIVSVHVSGGGISAQADAVRHGIARALLAAEPTLRGELKKLGYLSRDARKKERKHFGFRKARKRKQWKKR